MSKRYGLAPGVQWRHWGEEDEGVVYVLSRFETHLLSEAGVLVLESLAEAGQALEAQALIQALVQGLPEVEASSPQAVQQEQQIREAQAQSLIHQLLSLGVIAEHAC